MRVTLLAAVPLIAALSAAPASAQVSARLHIGVPVGRPVVRGYVRGRAPLVIGAYLPERFGAWEDSYSQWAPVTVYYYDGAYYDYPIVEYATPVSVYSYRDQLFFPPRDRAFIGFREQTGRYEGRPGYEAPRYPLARPRVSGRAAERFDARPADRNMYRGPARSGQYAGRESYSQPAPSERRSAPPANRNGQHDSRPRSGQ